MRQWLLLHDGAQGVALPLRAIEIANGPEEASIDALRVTSVAVNGTRDGSLAASARAGAGVALRWLAREFGRTISLARLAVEHAPVDATLVGRSTELAMALAVALQIVRIDRLIAGLEEAPAIAATGVLDLQGNVGPVQGLADKLAALLRVDEAAGCRVFFPRADAQAIPEAVRREAVQRGLRLCPVDRFEEALAELGIPSSGWWQGPPYRALQPFELVHSRIYFGRRAEVDALLDRMQQRCAVGRPGMLIVGPSGVGKSSFAQAGLLAALRRQRGDAALRYALWRPRDAAAGHDGMLDEAALAASLAASWLRPVGGVAPWIPHASSLDVASPAQLAAALRPPSEPDGILRVWLVDQLEEIFTLPFTPGALLALAGFLRQAQAAGAWTVATLRNDFYADYQGVQDAAGRAAFVDVFGAEGQFDLGAMGRDALRQVIERPAQLAGLRFEARGADEVALNDKLLADATATPDVLPLLEYALHQLYERPLAGKAASDIADISPRTLGFAAYAAIGELRGAIGMVAEQAFVALDDAAQATLGRLIGALAQPAQRPGQEMARAIELGAWPADDPAHRLAGALVGIRVLVSDAAQGAAPRLRVAHEALFTHWERAREALAASHTFRREVQLFAQKEEAWHASQRDDELLTSARDLGIAADMLPALRLEPALSRLRDYVELSLRIQDAARAGELKAARKRVLVLSVLGALLLVMLALTLAANWQARRSEQLALQEREHAGQAASRAEAAATLAERERQRADTRAEEARSANRAAAVERDAALQQRRLADQARDEAQDQRAVLLAQRAREAVERSDAGSALATALAGVPDDVGRAPIPEVEAALLSAWWARRELHTLVAGDLPVWAGIAAPAGDRLLTFAMDPFRREQRELRLWSLAGAPARSVPIEIGPREQWVSDFSGDGSSFVTLPAEQPPLLWRLQSGRPVKQSLAGHDKGARDALFSAAGHWLLTSAADGTVRLRALGRADDAGTLLASDGDRGAAAFSGDGRLVAVPVANGSVRVWETNQPARDPQIVPTAAARLIVRFCAGQHQLLTVSDDRLVQRWDLEGTQVSPLASSPLKLGVTAVGVSADCRWVATHRTTTQPMDVNLVRVDGTQAEVVSLAGVIPDARRTTNAPFSADGSLFVTEDDGHRLLVWRTLRPTDPPLVLAGHVARVTSVSFSADGRRLLSTSEDRTTRIWSLEAPAASIVKSQEGTPLGLGQRSSHVFVAGPRVARIWNLGRPDEEGMPFDQPLAAVAEVHFSDDGRRVVTIGRDSQARLWSVAAKSISPMSIGRSLALAAVPGRTRLSPDGRWLVELPARGQTVLQLWDLDHPASAPAMLSGHAATISDAAFSPDSRTLATSSEDSTVRLWRLDAPTLPPVVLDTDKTFTARVAFSGDGRLLAVGEFGGIRLWDLGPDGAPRTRDLKEHRNIVQHLAFSPSGQWLASTAVDGLRVWKIDEATVRSTVLDERPAGPHAPVFSDDGRWLAIEGGGQTGPAPRLWKVDHQRFVPVVLPGLGNGPVALGFAPGSAELITSGPDGRMRRWPLLQGAALLRAARGAMTRCLTDDQLVSLGLAARGMARGTAVTVPPCRFGAVAAATSPGTGALR